MKPYIPMAELNKEDEDFFKEILKIKKEEPEKFMDMILEILKGDLKYVLNDDAPKENKVIELKNMQKHYESVERYEDCAFISKILKELEQ
jgi:hypothetical protein